MMRKERPSSIIVIGLLLIFFGGIGFLCLFTLQDEMILPIILLWPKTFFFTICGAFILIGKNWSRLLYLWGAPVFHVIEIILVGFNWNNIVRLGLYVVLFGFLTQPNVRTYMKGGIS
jgi:hypothetical protein